MKTSDGMQCVCGALVPWGDAGGGVTQISNLKFYESLSMWGHPAARSKVFLCVRCTTKFIELMTELKRGYDTEEVV